ncbi:MAG: aquaporin [Actinomycetota bacterium]|nr:aquaporin [Actinomycetota bacterium]
MVDDRATGTEEAVVVERERRPVEASLVRRLLAEFIGATLLVAVGSGAAAVSLMGPALRFEALNVGNALQGAPQERVVFQQLFANSLGDLLPVAFAFAIILGVLVYALGGVSGAHFNPAVTLALAAVRRFRWTEVIPYWVVQCLGGILGAAIIYGIYKEQAGEIISVVEQIDPATGQPAGTADIPTAILFGATVVADNIEFFQALLAEAVIGFILMTAIMAVAVDPRAPKGWSGLIIGLALGGGILVTAQATGGSANFARSLGPFVATVFFGEDQSIPWNDLIVYAAGPVIGALLAAFIYEGVTGLERVSPAPSPGAATPEPEALLDEVDEPATGSTVIESETRRTDEKGPPAS